jgi:hypothetical protein
MSKVTYNYSLGKIMMKIDLRTCNQKERPVPVSPNLTQTSRRFVKFELLFTEQMCDNGTDRTTYERHKFEVKEPKSSGPHLLYTSYPNKEVNLFGLSRYSQQILIYTRSLNINAYLAYATVN